MGRPDGFMIYERKEQPAASLRSGCVISMSFMPLSARRSGVNRQRGA